MNTKQTLLIATFACALTAFTALGEGADRAPRHQTGDQAGPREHRGGGPLLAVLDVNQDGILDAAEIAGASEALKKLDKDGDGKISAEELRPDGNRGPAHQTRAEKGTRHASADQLPPLPPRPPRHDRGAGRDVAQLPPAPPTHASAEVPPPAHEDFDR